MANFTVRRSIRRCSAAGRDDGRGLGALGEGPLHDRGRVGLVDAAPADDDPVAGGARVGEGAPQVLAAGLGPAVVVGADSAEDELRTGGQRRRVGEGHGRARRAAVLVRPVARRARRDARHRGERRDERGPEDRREGLRAGRRHPALEVGRRAVDEGPAGRGAGDKVRAAAHTAERPRGADVAARAAVVVVGLQVAADAAGAHDLRARTHRHDRGADAALARLTRRAGPAAQAAVGVVGLAVDADPAAGDLPRPAGDGGRGAGAGGADLTGRAGAAAGAAVGGVALEVALAAVPGREVAVAVARVAGDAAERAGAGRCAVRAGDAAVVAAAAVVHVASEVGAVAQAVEGCALDFPGRADGPVAGAVAADLRVGAADAAGAAVLAVAPEVALAAVEVEAVAVREALVAGADAAGAGHAARHRVGAGRAGVGAGAAVHGVAPEGHLAAVGGQGVAVPEAGVAGGAAGAVRARRIDVRQVERAARAAADVAAGAAVGDLGLDVDADRAAGGATTRAGEVAAARIADRARAARPTAGAAVAGGAEVGLAAVRRVAVAVVEARVAGRDLAGARDADPVGVLERAGRTARAAVVAVAREVDLAAVRPVAVAVGEARQAVVPAGPSGAHRRRVGAGRAGGAARAAVHGVGLEVRAGGAAHRLPRGARRRAGPALAGLTRCAGPAAGAAVGGTVQVRLAAVRHVAVAVVEATDAVRDAAGARDADPVGVGERAGRAARAAVVGAARQVDLAAVRPVAVAVGEARVAEHLAGADDAGRDRVRADRADGSAGAAVVHVGRERRAGGPADRLTRGAGRGAGTVRADLAGRAGVAAAAAVGGAVEVRLAAVDHLAVAVDEPTDAARDAAGAGHAGGVGVGERADDAAPAAVRDVALHVDAGRRRGAGGAVELPGRAHGAVRAAGPVAGSVRLAGRAAGARRAARDAPAAVARLRPEGRRAEVGRAGHRVRRQLGIRGGVRAGVHHDLGVVGVGLGIAPVRPLAGAREGRKEHSYLDETGARLHDGTSCDRSTTARDARSSERAFLLL